MTEPAPTPAQVLARRLGFPDPDDALLEELTEALEAAESDVEGYLGRPIRPVVKTAAGCWPVPGGWDIPGERGRIRRIVSAVPEHLPDQPTVTSGTFTITYEVGLDYLADRELRPIRRYVTAAAMNDPTLLAYLTRTGGHGPIKSVSVSTEGQSKNVTYGDVGYGGGGEAGKDSPGALPAKSSMDRWRVANRRVVQAPDLAYDSRTQTVVGGGGRAYRDRDGFWNLP